MSAFFFFLSDEEGGTFQFDAEQRFNIHGTTKTTSASTEMLNYLIV